MFSNKLLTRLKNAYSVTALTGAGISAESGVPTFRGKDGIWKNNKVEEIATIDALEKNPKLFWDFYWWRRDLLKEIKPNLAHYALVEFEKYFEDFLVITQNVDNLHISAGSQQIIEIHGNINRNKCPQCNEIAQDYTLNEEKIPICSTCSSFIRPDVILFGENLDEIKLRKARQASAECEVFFSIGTSGLVEPAASLPFLAIANGSYVVEINAEETPLSQNANETIRGPAGKILPQLAIILEKISS
jgi:NAD-dependent deacetylase